MTPGSEHAVTWEIRPCCLMSWALTCTAESIMLHLHSSAWDMLQASPCSIRCHPGWRSVLCPYQNLQLRSKGGLSHLYTLQILGCSGGWKGSQLSKIKTVLRACVPYSDLPRQPCHPCTAQNPSTAHLSLPQPCFQHGQPCKGFLWGWPYRVFYSTCTRGIFPPTTIGLSWPLNAEMSILSPVRDKILQEFR